MSLDQPWVWRVRGIRDVLLEERTPKLVLKENKVARTGKVQMAFHPSSILAVLTE